MNKIKQKIRVRTIRSFRGHPAGTILTPLSGAARQMLLETKDALGRPIAELVEEDPVTDETPNDAEAAPPLADEPVTDAPPAPSKPSRRKAAA